ncbi:MAG: hypothetical protein K1X57_19260 [Gemmataceae bacterium]|nr:hypothetical protein [Gemmataceae bacterium]
MASTLPESPPPKQGTSKRPTALFNFWVDVALAISVLSLTWVSAMMQVTFPAPTAAGGWVLWGWTFDQWRNLQFGLLCVCVLLALEHVVLHWPWVCGVIATKILKVKKKPDEANQAMYGIAFFFAIFLLLKAATIAAVFTVKHPPGR